MSLRDSASGLFSPHSLLEFSARVLTLRPILKEAASQARRVSLVACGQDLSTWMRPDKIDGRIIVSCESNLPTEATNAIPLVINPESLEPELQRPP